MQRHVETGQLVQDAHPTLLEVLMKSVLTVVLVFFFDFIGKVLVLARSRV